MGTSSKGPYASRVVYPGAGRTRLSARRCKHRRDPLATGPASGVDIRRTTVGDERGSQPPHDTVEEHGDGHGVAVGPNGPVVLARRDPIGESLVTASFRVSHTVDNALDGKLEPTSQEGYARGFPGPRRARDKHLRQPGSPRARANWIRTELNTALGAFGLGGLSVLAVKRHAGCSGPTFVSRRWISNGAAVEGIATLETQLLIWAHCTGAHRP